MVKRFDDMFQCFNNDHNGLWWSDGQNSDNNCILCLHIMCQKNKNY